jgi:hypothetical protein
MKKASIFLELILKALVPLKMSSKSLVIFKNLRFLIKEYISLQIVFKEPRNFYESLTVIIKSLHISENVFKKPQNRSKCLTLLGKPHIILKKASIPLKVYFLKASTSLKKPHIY